MIKHAFHGFAVRESARSIVPTGLLISFPPLALVSMKKEHQLLLNLLSFLRVGRLVGGASRTWWELVSAREQVWYGIIGTGRRWRWNSSLSHGLSQTGCWRVNRVGLRLLVLRQQIFVNLEKNTYKIIIMVLKHSTREEALRMRNMTGNLHVRLKRTHSAKLHVHIRTPQSNFYTCSPCTTIATQRKSTQ